MPRSISFHPKARRDLRKQITYFTEEVSRKLAARYILSLRTALRLLADMPELGAPVSVRRRRLKRVRCWSVNRPFQNYLIYYRPLPNGIEVLHLVHGARDLDALLGR
jgi:toxin ParE1/3/4